MPGTLDSQGASQTSGVAAGPWEGSMESLVCWRGRDRSGCVLTRVGLRTIREGVGLGN